MSDNIAAQLGANAYARPTYNQQMPPEGRVKSLPVYMDMTLNVAVSINMEVTASRGVIDFIQSVYIDNSENAGVFTLQIVAGQKITVPPRHQGYFPIMVPNPPNFTALSTATAKVSLFFLNVPMPLGMWNTEAASSGGGGIVGITPQFSSNFYTGGVSEELLPADPDRTYLLIQAPSVDVWVNWGDGATDAGEDNGILLVAGTIYESGNSVPITPVYIYPVSDAVVTVQWVGGI